MPTGMLILLITAALIYFGAAQRVLDRMRLTDAQALLFIGLMIGGSFIDIPLYRGAVEISVNVGGALVPLALCIYLLLRADSARETFRGAAAAVVTAGIVFAVSQITEFGPTDRTLVDPMWLFGIVAGAVGYLTARSRRSAFIAGTLGIILTDVIHMARSLVMDIPTTVALGGAGIFDTVVIAGIVAVLLAELFGEIRERLHGGPKSSRVGNEGKDELD